MPASIKLVTSKAPRKSAEPETQERIREYLNAHNRSGRPGRATDNG